MNIVVNKNIKIIFTLKEIKILTEAVELLNKTSDKLWQSDDDELMDRACMIGGVAGSIEDIINDEY